MNLKVAKKLQPGAIVREAWCSEFSAQGIVLTKQYVRKKHDAKLLCRPKEERYDVTVHWLGPARSIPREKWGDNGSRRVQVRENWELMVISHA